MTSIVCCACEQEISLDDIPFCKRCRELLDPEEARARELTHVLGPLKGAKDHITNRAGGCVSWCPACRPATTEQEQEHG